MGNIWNLFIIQLFSEVGALVGRKAGGIAYMAHIGGFVFGMASARLLWSRKNVLSKCSEVSRGKSFFTE